MKVVAVIPARGGSKRLPGKNIRMFAGHPLLAHSVALARSMPRIHKCVVSTDDAETARVARRYGADVVTRPAHLATDTATSASAVKHALDVLAADGFEADAVVLLQPNCPLRPASVVADALDAFAPRDVDSVLSVTRSHHKLGTIDDSLFVPAYVPGMRSQDLAPSYYENGVVYVSDARMARERETLFGERARAIVTDPIYALGDIDTLLDFQIAEFLHRTYADRFVIPETPRFDSCAPSS